MTTSQDHPKRLFIKNVAWPIVDNYVELICSDGRKFSDDIEYIRADLAGATEKPASDLSSEHEFALMEGARNHGEDEYFKARAEMLDTIHNRTLFKAGFDRGWMAEKPKASTGAGDEAPVDMLLYCPKCGMQHIDAPEPPLYGHKRLIEGWTNPPHRSHLCHECGHIWRPADVATNGVSEIKTKGKADSPLFDPAQFYAAAAENAVALDRLRSTQASAAQAVGDALCSDCPPEGYPTDITRCIKSDYCRELELHINYIALVHADEYEKVSTASPFEKLHAIKATFLRYEQAPPKPNEDAARLDFLDRMNAALNRKYGTDYGWRLIISPNIVRLMSGRHASGFVGDIDLNDADGSKSRFTSCRDAIDEVMAALAAHPQKGDEL